MDEKSEPDRSFPVLVELAIEGWRFQKLFTKALAKLDPAEAARFVNQHRFFVRKIDDAVAAVGVRFVSIEGEPFDVGAAVTALNLADFGPGEQVVVTDRSGLKAGQAVRPKPLQPMSYEGKSPQ